MNKLKYTFLAILLLIGVSLTWNKCAITKTKTNALKEDMAEAESYYANYCASCHGKQVRAFVDKDTWLYGSSRNDLFSIVKNGADKDGMPAYGQVLSDSQIDDLVDYILEAIEDQKAEEFNNGENTEVVFMSEDMKLKLELVAENADSPWGITQSSDGTLFYTDKSGELFSKKGSDITEISGVPEVNFRGQGGLMDVILHPNFETNQRIYLSYSKPRLGDNNYSTTAIFSGILEGKTIKNGEDIYIAKPYVNTNHHYGSRMVFDNEGYLYVTVGERGKRDDHPQQLDNHPGKIHRLNDDGTVPLDNPFYDTPYAVKSIFSYGHRNPQGLCYNAETNKIYDNEHGPRGGDEINLIKPGNNYGWPVITYGINYVGTKITDITHKEGMEQPIRYWVPSIATCGMEVITSEKYPGWKGNILSGSLKFNYLHRDVFDENDKWVTEEKLFPDIGRMRSVEQCADGFIYIGMEDPGRIYRIVPL
ncbi:MAG: PQQ-dependent sugar dehydrogenase [Flavobacteriales bacterium]